MQCVLVVVYRRTLRHIREERRPYLQGGGSLKSHTSNKVYDLFVIICSPSPLGRVYSSNSKGSVTSIFRMILKRLSDENW